MVPRFHKLAGPKKEAYRLKLSAKLIHELGWEHYPDEFGCYGVFRTEGEVLCAATNLKNSEGEHPFAAALEFLALSDPPIETLRDIPSARVLVASDRVFEFEGVRSGSQLELRLTTTVIERLGWDKQYESKPPIYARACSAILLLLSDRRFKEIVREDFTGGELNV